MPILPCPCQKSVTGKVKVVKRGLATGMGAELAAIDEALKIAESAAQKAMDGVRCAKPCAIAFKPPTFVVRASGSTNNLQIVGAAIVEWTIYPICVKPPKSKLRPAAPAKKPIGGNIPIVPVSVKARYPFIKKTPCGTITISIVHGAPDVKDGAIRFDFTPQSSAECRCEMFGWIQHVQMSSSHWRYDNGTDYSMHGPIGAPSDPSRTVQPMNPSDPGWTGNPWYGASSAPNAPADFAQNPKPQTTIGDKPTQRNISFVTQLVCVTTGEVLFSWFWGPVPNGDTPLEDVPAGPTPPP